MQYFIFIIFISNIRIQPNSFGYWSRPVMLLKKEFSHIIFGKNLVNSKSLLGLWNQTDIKQTTQLINFKSAYQWSNEENLYLFNNSNRSECYKWLTQSQFRQYFAAWRKLSKDGRCEWVALCRISTTHWGIPT